MLAYRTTAYNFGLLSSQYRLMSNMTKMVKPSTCYYKVLNVSTTASVKDIKASYYQMAKKFHPDSFLSQDKKPTEAEFNEVDRKFKAITEAYSVLSDHEKRTKYDQLIFGDSAQTPRDFDN
jgi:DnaJ-class molecular chaperone